MGRVFCTFEEAAERLKRSKRTIHTYVKKGILRRTLDNGRVLLLVEEVEQLAQDEGTDTPALNRKTLLELMARVRHLEEVTAVFRKMYGIDDRLPLRPEGDEAYSLHALASNMLEQKKFSLEEVDLWISTLSRMDEVTFDLMVKTGLQDTCWQPFFKLCIALMDFVSDPKRYGSKPGWHQRHMELDECRKKLRDTAIIWTEMGRGVTPLKLIQDLDSSKEDLLRRLNYRASKS